MSARSIETAFPCTPLQEGMLYHTIRHPESRLYRGQCAARLDGPMDDDLFRAAWDRLCDRHQAFRSFFAWEGRDRPLQVVRRKVELSWEVLDWRGVAEDEREQRWQELLADDATRTFDLKEAPLMRFVLVHLTDEHHGVVWSVYHGLADGWSAQRVLHEALETYAALGAGERDDGVAPPSFATFISWLDSRDRRAAERFWRSHLAGVASATPLPAASTLSAGTTRATVDRSLDARALASIHRATARFRVTLNTLVTGAWALVLGRYSTDEDDVVFGVTLAERPSEIPGVAGSVGPYLSTVPIRVGVTDDRAVEAWLCELQCLLGDARAHSVGGLPEIQRWTDVPGGQPLLTSSVAYEAFPPGLFNDRVDATLRLASTQVSAPSDLPISLLVYPGDELLLRLEYDPSRYEREVAASLLDAVAQALAELSRGPDRPIAEVDILDSDTTDLLAWEWSGADVPSLRDVQDVLELFDAQVARRGSASAVRAGGATLTYAELDDRAALRARRIAAEVPDRDGLVAVSADPGLDTIVSIVACLKAGRGYTLFDPTHPRVRVETALRHAALVLGATDGGGSTSDLDFQAKLASVRHDALTEGPASDTGEHALRSDSVAYVVWTSGSTGAPKGVVVERRHLAHSVAARLAWYGDGPGSFLLLSPLSVDSSVAGLYWTLCSGGCLVLPSRGTTQDLPALLDLLKEEAVTTTLLVPSLHRMLLEEAGSDALASLQRVVVAGEACPASVVALHRQRFPNVALVNEYGPSEATVWATASKPVDEPFGPVSVGRPIPGVRIYLLDRRGRLVPPGAPGEICIAGPTVARGYLGDPELTARRFGPDPFVEGQRLYRTGDRGRFLMDGRLEFLGRIDEQLKLRGFRVEPAEIEGALAEHPAVVEAVVSLERAAETAPNDDVDAITRLLASWPAETVDALLTSVESLP